MTSVVMRNNRGTSLPVVPPLHSDGTGYRYCMYYSGDEAVAFADSTAELVDVLLPGYEELEESERLARRTQHALSAATWTQAMILANSDLSDVTEDERAVLLSSREANPPRADVWMSRVPLVVVETSYVPFTEVPPPTSAITPAEGALNLLWLRPANEGEYLVSLHQLGVVTLMENEAFGD